MPDRLSTGPLAKATPCVAVLLSPGSGELPGHLASLDERIGGELTRLLQRSEFRGQSGDLATLYPTGEGPQRVYAVGLGEPQSEPARSRQQLRTAAAALTRALVSAEVGAAEVVPPPGFAGLDDDAVGRAIGEGASLAWFHYTEHHGAVGRASANKRGGGARALTLRAEGELLAGIRHGLQVGESVNLARALAATPPNVANPAHLVELAKRVAKETGMACKVIDAASARKLGMGGLVAVGQAGSTPPALIALEWNGGRPARQPGKGQGKAKAGPVLLVGKAITFDTGGYSLKDAKGMLGMKYDKCGGAAVLGAMHAIASLKLPVHVVGLIAAAENMVDSTAYRPNDIITHHNGVTCEITNTDAEGRLVLADALAYGCRTYRPAAVIDLATLTGGVIVALGSITAGLFCNHAQLRARVMDAGDDTGERLWHLPLWDEHRDLMRGSHSDLVNSSVKVDRDCHPIQGAAYLSYFVAPDADPSKPGSLPWAHIDIAGVANVKQGSALYEAGPTGWGVRLLTRLVEQWSPLDPES